MKHSLEGAASSWHLNPDWDDLYDQLDGWDKPGHDRECGTIEHLSARMGVKALRKKKPPRNGAAPILVARLAV
jgi:hypothetical protein